jgi:hypothetical protein
VFTPRFTALFALVAGAIGYGWSIRDQELFSPKDGAGYYLGIAGGVMLLLLLHYSARKRLGFMHRWGRLPSWLNAHIALGLLGPTAILYHCNFHLGAVNSNVALASMLTVMSSGFVGRFLYLYLNQTLAGELINLEVMQRRLAAARSELDHSATAGAVRQRLAEFERRQLRERMGFFPMVGSLLLLGKRTRALRQSVLQGADVEKEQLDRELIGGYIDAVGRVAEYSAYRRIFALWHVVHIPLFVMLVVTGLVHVAAVHFLY